MEKRKMEIEFAVSPVIGVMLMLVVTIIIGAVVTMFAGGLTGGLSETPQASIDVDIGDIGYGFILTFNLMAGDPIPTKDLAIITNFRNNTSYAYNGYRNAQSGLVNIYPAYPSYNYYTRLPALNNLQKGGANQPYMHFGNFTWEVGDIMYSGTDAGTAYMLGMNDYWNATGTLDPNLKDDGATVEVKILHVPSNKFIYDKEVQVK